MSATRNQVTLFPAVTLFCRKLGVVCLPQVPDAFWSCRKRFTRCVSYEAVNTVTQNVVALIACRNKYIRNMLIAGLC